MNKQIKQIKQKVVPVLLENKVSKAGLFGSYARGEQNKKSDVDILVKIDDNRSLLEVIHLKNVLQKSLKKKVDLVEYDTIRAELKASILNEEIPLI